MSSFPAAELPTVTELLIGGSWTDVSHRVRDTDKDPGVVITRGQSPESLQAQPSRMSLSFDNRDGALSNRLPTATYYGQLGRNTQIRQRLRWVLDSFARTTANGWGTEESGNGYTWSTSGGSASDFSTSVGLGLAGILFSATGLKQTQVGPLLSDARVTIRVRPEVNASGGPIDLGCSLRRDSVADIAYEFLVRFEVGGTTRLRVNQVVSGVATNIFDAALADTYNGSSAFWITADANGNRLRAKAWSVSSSEPDWQANFTNGNIPRSSPGQCGAVARVQTGNTNVPFTPHFDNVDISDFRFWGEVAAWPPTSDVTGNDVTIPIEAAGIMRRLGTSGKPLRSPLFRTMAGVAPGDYRPFIYWPMEDGTDATRFASGIAGGAPLTLPGGATPGTIEGPAGSQALPALAAGSNLSFAVPAYSGTKIAFQWLMQIPAEPAGTEKLAEFYADSGPVRRWEITVVPGSPANIWLNDYDASGTLINATGIPLNGASTSNPAESDFFGHWAMFIFGPEQSGGNVHSWAGVSIGPPGGGVGIGNTDAGTLGSITRGRLYGGSGGNRVGHLVAYTDPNFDLGFTSNAAKANVLAMHGYNGETAADRMTRLCFEEQIPFELVGNASDTVTMGAQRVDTLLANLYDCAGADLGLLYEPRDALAVGYRTRTSLYNQTGPTLTYSSGQVSPPFAPVEDDRLTVNDATARRPNGSSARVTITSGSLSTQDPPNGAGVYDEDRTYNISDDGPLLLIAGWRAYLGSWDELRFPQVSVNLARLYRDAKTTLAGQVAAVDVGDYLAVGGPPAWLPPDLIEMLAFGYTERHRNFQWTLTFNTAPAAPLAFGIVADTVLVLADAGGFSTTSGSFSAGVGTSLTVATSSGPLWTTGSVSFDIKVAGVVLRVTNISGAASPQTFTVNATTINGVVKTIPSGSQVYLAHPMRAAY